MTVEGLQIVPTADLSAVLLRKDGTRSDVLYLRQQADLKLLAKKLLKPLGFWHRIYHQLRSSNLIPGALTFAAFVHYLYHKSPNDLQVALVTTAGINILAADFVSGAGTHISTFNFHDSGVGTTAAAIGDTVLQTQSGPTTRATGTQSTPSSGQYRSVGTISYTSTLAITEWGLFSQAAQGGTLWDHRIFAAINVSSGDSIQFTYTLTCPAGGS